MEHSVQYCTILCNIVCFEWQVVCALPWKSINLRFKCLHSRINCTPNLREIWRSYLTVLAVRNFCFPPAQKASHAINIVEHSNQLRDWHWQDLFSFFFSLSLWLVSPCWRVLRYIRFSKSIRFGMRRHHSSCVQFLVNLRWRFVTKLAAPGRPEMPSSIVDDVGCTLLSLENMSFRLTYLCVQMQIVPSGQLMLRERGFYCVWFGCRTISGATARTVYVLLSYRNEFLKV